MGNADHFNLAELVLAQHAPGILAGGTGLRTEALRPGGPADRQFLAFMHPAGRKIGQWHFRGRDQPVIVLGPVQIRGEFRELAGSV